MDAKVKSGIILSATLLIGILIGAFGSGFLRNTFMSDTRYEFRKPDRFIRMQERLIKPTVEQREAVEKVLRDHHKKMLELSHSMMEQFKGTDDSLMKALEPILSEEQMEAYKERLQEHHRRAPWMREKDRGKRAKRRPPV